ncbi:Hypp1217 [Branchiostoma lanceolatum]|uniref:Hypp1217 protein n=1 Tax=Branchiostoma lanceolatum TaxID=7740 RepID=A0A8K0EHQ8_BRALA|nr:Hypp1217 [Branchiostoma lanceolatum]
MIQDEETPQGATPKPRRKCPILGTNLRATTTSRSDAPHNHEVYARLLHGCKLIMDSSLLKFIGVRPRWDSGIEWEKKGERKALRVGGRQD